jgi:polysaccharide export outer membrane protein
MNHLRTILLTGLSGLCALLVVTACAQASPGEANTRNSSVESTKVMQPATIDPDYVIGPLDTLNVSVWKEPEVSGQVIVRNDGKISLALLKDIEAAGNTPTQLAAVITDKLKQYIANPNVTVIVTAIKSKRVFLMGEVGHNGPIDMLPKMTVLQALASGGGFSKYANLKKIYVLRNENGKQMKIPFNYKAVIRGQSPEQNIELQPGDTIVVP